MQWGFLYIVWPSVLSLNNLKIHKTKAVKNFCVQEKCIIRLIFDLTRDPIETLDQRPLATPPLYFKSVPRAFPVEVGIGNEVVQYEHRCIVGDS